MMVCLDGPEHDGRIHGSGRKCPIDATCGDDKEYRISRSKTDNTLRIICGLADRRAVSRPSGLRGASCFLSRS